MASHFIQPFADPADGLVHVWRRSTQRITRQPPRKTAVRTHFHTVTISTGQTDILERAVTHIENGAVADLQLMAAGGLDAGMTSKQKANLARYLGLLWGRTEKQRSQMLQILKGGQLPAPQVDDRGFQELVKHANITGSAEEKEAWTVVLRPLLSGQAFSGVHEALLGLALGHVTMAPILDSMRWTVYRRSRAPFFCSGSEPIAVVSKDSAWRLGAHPQDRSTVIAVAVSPERLLFMDHDQGDDRQRPADFAYPELRDLTYGFLGVYDDRLTDPVAWWAHYLAHSGAGEVYARQAGDLDMIRKEGLPPPHS